MRSYTFAKSGFEIVLDVDAGSYGLGPKRTLGPSDGDLPWPEMGPIPTTRLAGYSSQPLDIPGWVVAMGGVAAGEGIHVLEGAIAVPEDAQIGDWQRLDFCVLADKMWAAELREDQRWLRFTSSSGTHTWHRPDRRKNRAREEPREL